jgi:inhibitor of cysteine peptidase
VKRGGVSMIRSILLLFVTVLFILFLAVCRSSSGDTVRLVEEDSGGTIVMFAGETFEIVLEGNPTTGYQWEVEPLDTPSLEQIGQPSYELSSDAIGAGGIYTFRFRAAAVGSTGVRLLYRRSFEKDVPPARVFEANVLVEKK